MSGITSSGTPPKNSSSPSGSGHESPAALARPAQATLWAEFGDASSEEAVVAFELGVAHDVQLRLLFGEARTGRLLGQVRDARTRQPVSAAAVSITDRPEVVATDRRGRFALSGLLVGGHELSVRHLGYATLTYPVTVTRGLTTEVDIGLSPDPVELEPLVATATRPRRLEIKGFYDTSTATS